MRSDDDPGGGKPILDTLATNVRALRHERAWSRARLAEVSGLSVRFLAQVEAGEGNISLRRLADLAEALATTPEAILRPAAPRTDLVVLVGLRGAGKSSVGPVLARALSIPFQEMDALIEQAAGLPVDQIFELHGERYYRRLERETAARLVAGGRSLVVAAAGGIVNEPATWELLARHATVVWLKASAEDHWNRVVAQGDRRPMADNPEAMTELRAMLAAREPLYSRAHLCVDTSGRSTSAVAEEIRRSIESRTS